MKYFTDKLLIFDIDGVLVDGNKINNIKFLKNHNINYTFCTGRGMKRAMSIIKEVAFENSNMVIINNGASILKKEHTIIEKHICSELIFHLFDLENKIDMNLIKFINVITSNKPGYQIYNPHNLIDLKNPLFECEMEFTTFAELIKYCIDQDIIKITIVMKDEITLDNQFQFQNFGFVKSDKHCLCMTETGINKMTGIIELSKYENISLNNIIYFGNDFNDYCVFDNSEIIKVYVHNSKIDRYLAERADHIVRFENLQEFLQKGCV